MWFLAPDSHAFSINPDAIAVEIAPSELEKKQEDNEVNMLKFFPMFFINYNFIILSTKCTFTIHYIGWENKTERF